ncbi:MBL fold metallo-hydrolase [Pelosinus sp. sgz500959]|uniref:MBL fold metallo-hydrolase n=1 Tax=Pelosinus sp. sgz500959 TaxID=3242472 RepID=UPI00366CEFA5
MEIKWFGQSCFTIISDNGARIVIDPFDKKIGYPLPDLEADIVTTSHNHSDHNNVSIVRGDFKHLEKPGEYLESGIAISGISTFHDSKGGIFRGNNIVFKYTIDDINVCHCGDLGHKFSSEQLGQIGSVDILLLPVGGLATINALAAVEVMEQLKPVITIPMHYRTKALGLLGYLFSPVEKFLSLSTRTTMTIKNLSLTKEDLETYHGIVVLDYRA